MKYQNDRGGRIMLQPIAKPSNDEWSSPLEAMTAALELEKSVNAVSFVIFSYLIFSIMHFSSVL